MSLRFDFFFLQAVTESELDDAFSGLEDADRALMTDQALVGIFAGGSVVQHNPTANLTVDVGGPMYAYDDFGQRIYIPGPTLNVNVAQDSSSVSTAVSGGGNEKWISIAAKFERALSDPRTDGNSATVYYRRDESYEIVVTQGAEAAIGTALRPTLDPDAVLLCDVNLVHSQTQIFNASISITRRQDVFVYAGPMGGQSIRAGTVGGAVLAMLTALNNHILLSGSAHPAGAINYGGGAAWKDGTTNPAATVEAQLDKIITDLTGTAGGNSGAERLGMAPLGGSWGGGHSVTNAPGTIFGAIDGIRSLLRDSSTDGADCIGAMTHAGSPTSLSSGTVGSQTIALLAAINARARTAGESISGTWTFDDITATSTNRYKLASRSLSRVSKAPIYNVTAATINFGGPGVTVGVGETSVQEIEVPDGATLTAVKVSIDPANTSPPAGTVPVLTVFLRDIVAGGAPSTLASKADPTTGGSYGSQHTFQTDAFSQVIDRTKHHVYISLAGESSTGANVLSFYGATAIFTATSQDDGAS